MNTKHLEIIRFKNRIWLLLILIPLIFALFFLTFMIHAIVRSSENPSILWFLFTFIIFFFELHLVKVFFSRFRYVPNGKLTFDKNGIYTCNSTYSINVTWSKISNIKFFYRGDRFWKFKLFGIELIKGNRRYHNLHWFGKKDLDERIIDRIDLNGKKILVKIRNENEKKIFHDLISLAKNNGCRLEIMETDFTTNIFGKTFEI